MKRLSRILVFIVLVSCSGNITSVRHGAFDAAERLMQARPDSALGLLRGTDTSGFNRAARAKYALLLSQALDKNYIDLKSDSIIRPAVEYYSRRGRATDRAWTYYYLARIHTNAGDLEAAIRAYVSAEHYAARCDDYNLRGLLYANMGNLYYNQYNLDGALQMYERSIEAYRKTDNLCNLERSLYAKAKTYYLSAQYTEALDFYRQSKTIAVKQGDSTKIADIDICIAATLLHDPATPDLDTVMRIVNSVYGTRPYQSKAWPLVCYYYFKTGQLDSTRRYTDMIINNLNNYSGWTAAGAYQILEKCGKYSFLPKFEYYKILDSLQSSVRKNFVAELDKKYRCDNILDSYTLLKHVHRYQTISTILVLVIIVVFICEILYVGKRNINKRNEALSNAIKYIEELRENYSVLNNKYNLVVERINASDTNAAVLIDALRHRIESLQELIEAANILDNNPKAFMAKFKKYIRSEYDKPALDSLCNVTNVYGYGIVDYLRDTYPRLSSSEIQMCCLLCLGFSSSCIRYIFNHKNSDSIYAMRFRLRTKLGLLRSDKLETFLTSLMKELSRKVN